MKLLAYHHKALQKSVEVITKHWLIRKWSIENALWKCWVKSQLLCFRYNTRDHSWRNSRSSGAAVYGAHTEHCRTTGNLLKGFQALFASILDKPTFVLPYMLTKRLINPCQQALDLLVFLWPQQAQRETSWDESLQRWWSPGLCPRKGCHSRQLDVQNRNDNTWSLWCLCKAEWQQ